MKSRINIPGISLLVVLAIAWELVARAAASPSVPTFSGTVAALFVHAGDLFTQMAITLSRAAMGFGLAVALMLPLGIFIGRTRRLGQYVEPLIDLLRPLPPLAIVPVAMLFAGTGTFAKVLVVFYSAAFPILINTIDATRATHPLLLQVGRSIGLSRGEIMRRIDLPAALPQIMAGIRIGVAIALLISVSAEMLLSTNGIGNFIMRAQEQFEITQGLAAILMIAVVSLAINAGIYRLEARMLRWHHQRRA